MKWLTNKFIITVFTFIIGIAIVIWFNKNSSKIISDTNIYSVKLCDLVSSNYYDEKIIQVEAVHYQGADSSGLVIENCSNNQTQIVTVCIAGTEACGRIFERMNSIKSTKAKVNIVGRYKADSINPQLPTSERRVHVFEILELKTIDEL